MKGDAFATDIQACRVETFHARHPRGSVIFYRPPSRQRYKTRHVPDGRADSLLVVPFSRSQLSLTIAGGGP